MKYDGVVIRFDMLYLFILDPDTDMIRDGITISEHECYKDMKEDQLMVVSVVFKDGTLEIDKIDLDEFIYGDTYGSYDTFLVIEDLMLFSISDREDNKRSVTLEELVQKGKLNNIAKECIESVKNNPDNNE